MPAPSASLATLRPEFGQSLQSFNLAMSRQGFIAPKVLPVIEAGVSAGIFGKLKIESLLQTRDVNRTSQGGYSRQKFEFTNDNFQTVEYGAEDPVDDRDAALYASFFAAEQLAGDRSRDVVLRAYEQRVANAVFNTTTWTGGSLTSAVSTPWSTVATATPISDVTTGKKKVWDNIGQQANTVIMNYHVYLNLQQNADLISRIKYSGLQDPNTQNITRAAMAQAFGVDQVLVAGGQYNTANEGQVASLSPLWSDSYCMICYVAQTNDIQEPAIGRTFHWGGDGSNISGAMETYRDETVRANIMRCRQEVQEKILLKECGFLLSNIT